MNLKKFVDVVRNEENQVSGRCQSEMNAHFVDVVRNEENQVSGRCQSEMNAHRKMLMDDYNISPEVVSKCAKDIQVKNMGLRNVSINEVFTEGSCGVWIIFATAGRNHSVLLKGLKIFVSSFVKKVQNYNRNTVCS